MNLWQHYTISNGINVTHILPNCFNTKCWSTKGGTPGEIRPPGPPGVKPVDVESLAKVVVSGAVGDLTGSIDGNEAISAMAS